MIIDDGDDFLAFLVFIARVANAIAPFLADLPQRKHHNPWKNKK